MYSGKCELKLALDIGGSAAHADALGDWDKIDRHLFYTLSLFKRIQLNVANRTDNPWHVWAPPYSYQELIVQQHDAENITLYTETRNYNYYEVTVLLDASGGRGIDTPLKVLKVNSKVGYAGGINPDNVADKLSFLLQNVRMGEFWIDMESGVRTDDWFDIDKVWKVLEICQPIIKDFSKED